MSKRNHHMRRQDNGGWLAPALRVGQQLLQLLVGGVYSLVFAVPKIVHLLPTNKHNVHRHNKHKATHVH